jgi:ribosome biogenesis GTPase A
MAGEAMRTAVAPGAVAMPLITVENDTQFIVHHETINFLKKQTHPIGVVGVAGLYRTGKSYLLNLLTGNSSSGFAVGSTINACTKGLISHSLLSVPSW